MRDALKTHHFGYSLMLDPGLRDIDEFARLVAAARASCDSGDIAQSVQNYRAALSLWRGPALSGLDSDAFHRKAVRLNEERLTILEECFDLELLQGRERTLLPELVTHVSENPLREKLRGQLMLALHRVGQRTDALQVYREGREQMVRELGLEPSEELRRLEKEILNDAPNLAPGTSITPAKQIIPRQLPPQPPYFTGRDEQVRQLCAALTGIAPPGNQATRAVNLFGQGGVGKTSLAIHVAYELMQEHFPDGQIYYDLHGSQPAPVSPARVLDHFLRVLGVPPPSIPDEMDERAAMFRSCVAGRRMLLVLDDAAGEDQIQPLLPGGWDCAVIVTSRTPQTGVPSLQKVRLDVLAVQDAVELLQRIVGDNRVGAEPAAATSLVRTVEGLPLALSIIGARLVTAPNRTISSMAQRVHDDRRSLDELVHGSQSVRSSIASVYHGLPQRLRNLLSLLSLFDMEAIPGWMAGVVIGVGPREALDLMDEAAACQLLLPVGVEPSNDPHYRFHNLTRLFLRETANRFAPERRREVVRRVVGAWLSLVEQAHGRLYGGNFTLVRGESPRWEPPAALVRHVLADPLHWLDVERSALLAAVGHAAAHGFDELCWELAINLVTLFEARFYRDDWRESHETALELVMRTGNVRGEAALRCSLGSLYISQRRIDRAKPQLEKALPIFEGLRDNGGTALTLRNLALCLHIQGAFNEALNAYGQAAELFLAAGDPIGQAHTWCNMAQIHASSSGNGATAQRLLTDALRICDEVGNQRVRSQVLFRLGELNLRLGLPEQAMSRFFTALPIVREQADRVGEGYVQRGLGNAQLAQGNLAEAERCFQSALALAKATGNSHDMALVRLSLAEVYLQQNRQQRAVALLGQALPVFRQYGDEESVNRTLSLLPPRS
ncbi:BTAD domain-containing putative transcriptional regulator [Streptomyces capitiformicae]|uniref:BTAD domain-containing putative transcriptional regulator n=1 Tax=Streptomyces capitiformicae TaxID=2014920 RepID=UPI001E604E38|nr:BTAD domain-containing putative transcriptional regulator [Streptomyces capitiformicae]